MVLLGSCINYQMSSGFAISHSFHLSRSLLQSRVASEAVRMLLNNGLTHEGVPRAEHVGVPSFRQPYLQLFCQVQG